MMFHSCGPKTPAEDAASPAPGRADLPAPAERSSLAAGTHVATDGGERPIERITAGTRVLTRDNGYRPVLWSGPVAAEPGRVVEIAADAFGPGRPARPLQVTPGHRLLLVSPQLLLLSGACEMFAAARLLVDGQRITVRRPRAQRTFHQIVLAEQEVILTEGLWTESLLVEAAPNAQPPGLPPALRQMLVGRHLCTARACLAECELRALLRAGGLPAGDMLAA